MYEINLKEFLKYDFLYQGSTIYKTGTNQSLEVPESREELANKIANKTKQFCGLLEDYAFAQYAQFYFTSVGRLSPVINYDPILKLRGYSARPTIVSMVTTKRCNLRCPHCYNNSGLATNTELTLEEKLEVVEYLGKWGISKLYLTGGEPLLDPAILPILDIAARYHVKVHISTNGWKLPVKIDNYIKNGTIRRVNLSIDGPNAMIHDGFRRKEGSFIRAIETANQFSKFNKLELIISTAVNKTNINHLESIVNLAINLNANMLSLKVVTFGRDGDSADFALDALDLVEFQKNRDELAHRYSGRIVIDGKVFDQGVSEIQSEEIGCTAGMTVMMINQDGYMMPCETLGPEGFPNIRSIKPIEAWLGHKKFIWFREFSKGQSCANCPGREAKRAMQKKGDIILYEQE